MLISFVFGFVRLFEDDGKPVPALANVLEIAQQIRKSDETLNNKKAVRDYLLTKWCHTKNGSFAPPNKARREFYMDENVSKRQLDILFEGFKKLGMIAPHVPIVGEDLLYIVVYAGAWDRAVAEFENAKNFYMSNKNRCKKAKIVFLTGERDVEKQSAQGKALDQGVPHILKTEKDIAHYIVARNADVPAVVVHGSRKERSYTQHYAQSLKEWVALQPDASGGVIVVVRRQPLSQWVLEAFRQCFKGTPYTIEALATPSLFRGANQDPMAEAINRMLPNSPNKMSRKEAVVCMDTLARIVSLAADMKF